MARPQEYDARDALRESLTVFWNKGYEATSVADLLEATGLSKSSLYSAFGGKRELFLSAFDSYRAQRVVEMNRMLAEGTGREAIERFFGAIIKDSQDPAAPRYGCMSTNEAVELAPHDPEVRARVNADFNTIETAIAEAVRRGQADGSIPAGKDAAEVARALLVSFPGLQVMVRARLDDDRLEAAFRTLMSVVLD